MDPRTTASTPYPPEPSAPIADNVPTVPQTNGKFSFLKSKKTFIILATILFLVLIGLSLWYFLKSRDEMTAITPPSKIQPNNTTDQNIKTYPKFEFTYTPILDVPGTPPDLYEYTLKNTFTTEDIASLSSHFNLSNPSVEKTIVTLKDTSQSSTSGYMVLNTETGTFEYQNTGSRVKITGSDLKASAVNFLSDLGLNEAIQCDITYENLEIPDTTFVECHRSWELLGAPLLNLPGLMNISENVSFSDLRLGYNSFPLSNKNIVNVSTGQNGIERPNDFNTATFAIRNDGTLVSLTSNLRFIEGKQKVELITPSDALTLFSQNKADTTLALPSGAGNFNWDSVFPKDKTATGNASISGIEISYKDNGPLEKQNTYSPTYIIRGNAELNSGYSVNYVQSISAKKNVLSSAQIADLSSRNNLQLGTFSLSTTPKITGAAPTKGQDGKSPARPTPTIRPPFTCDQTSIFNTGDPLDQSKIVVQLPSGERITVMHVTWSLEVNTFWLLQDNLTNEKLKQIRAEFRELATTGYLKDIPYASFFSAYFQEEHECYLTGASPSIFLYSNTPTEFKVTPKYALYVDPSLSKGSWDVSVNKNGIVSVNNVSRNYLYYEFNKQFVNFEKQENGFVLLLEDLNSFASKLSKEMKLNTKESERLLFELKLAAKDLPADTTHIKISLVPTTEINKKLPLETNPKPEFTNRYHFLLSKADKNEKANKPAIPAVIRGSSTLIEIGASAKN